MRVRGALCSALLLAAAWAHPKWTHPSSTIPFVTFGNGGHHPQLPQHHHHSSVHTKHITNPDRGLEELRADEIAADVRATFVRDQSKCPNYNKWPKSSDGDFSVEKIRDQVIERLYEPGRIFQGSANWCGFAAVLRLLADLQPEDYVSFVRELYCRGKWPHRAVEVGFDWNDEVDTLIYNSSASALRISDFKKFWVPEVDALMMYSMNDEANILLPAGTGYATGSAFSGSIETILKMLLPTRCRQTRQISDVDDIIDKILTVILQNNQDNSIVRSFLRRAPVILLVDPTVLWGTAKEKGVFGSIINQFTAHYIRMQSMSVELLPGKDPKKAKPEDYKYMLFYSDSTTRYLEDDQEFSYAKLKSLIKSIPEVSSASIFCVPEKCPPKAQRTADDDTTMLIRKGTVMCM